MAASNTRITESVKLRAIELRADGLSFERISKELSIAKQSAVDIIKENAEQVDTLRAVAVEATYEANQLNRAGRINQLVALHNRLREEIERRDLTDLPTKDLVTLFLKTSGTLKGEVVYGEILSSEQQATAKQRRSLDWMI